MTGLLTPAHIVVLLVVLLLLFGAKRLPELGRSLGSGLREFKNSVAAEHSDERATLPPPHAPGGLAQPASAPPAPEAAIAEVQPS